MSLRNHADCTAILTIAGRSLLAQFGLTPKSKRGLAPGEVGEVQRLKGVIEIRHSQIDEMNERLWMLDLG